MKNLEHTSLGEQVSKKVSLWILILIATITIGIFSISYLLSKQVFNKQVSIWNKVVPQNILSNLIDSDYFSIKKEVNFLESTGLFSSFVITDNQKRVISEFGHNKFNKLQFIPIIDEAKIVWGYYSFTTNFYKFFSPFLIGIGVFSALVLIIYFIIRWRLASDLGREFSRFNHFLKEIEMVTERLHEVYDENYFSSEAKFLFNTEQEIINRAISRLFNEIKKANQSLREAILAAEQKRFQEELTRTALQVAHDVGSPLAVLETIVQSDSLMMPEESRIFIRNAASRIRDITNSLLKQSKQDIFSINEDSLRQQLLLTLVNLAVSEKRLQYFEKTEIKIHFNFDKNSYGIFSFVRATDFSRVFSNIINNAIEALNEKGHVFISLSKIDNYAVITIEDNGKGMSREVLSKIGKIGVTFGKLNGHGLGLFYAKAIIEKWSGLLEIQSELGKGTTVKIFLPITQPPTWYIPEIILADKQQVIVIDDDESIHNVWRERFRKLKNESNKTVILKHFYNPNEFKAWKESNSEVSNGVIHLCDYEFIGSDVNGIDLISNLKIHYVSVLVTSRFNLEEIFSQCEASGIKLLPKEVANFIPLSIQ